MNRKTLLLCLLTVLPAGLSVSNAEETPVVLKLTGDWQVQVTLPASSETPKEQTATFNVSPAAMVDVHAEKYDRLPSFNPNTAGWVKGAPLRGLVCQECTARGLLVPESLSVRAGVEVNALRFELGKDYGADLEWGTVGRLPDGRIREDQPVWIDYRYVAPRLDSIILNAQGRLELRESKPSVPMTLPPEIVAGEHRLANICVIERICKLESRHLYPILQPSYPHPTSSSPTPAEQLLPKTMQKLREGGRLKILAWGDSVTDGGFLPDADRNRWQAQFVAQLRARFPKATIELVSQGWGGRNTASFLAEPSGSPHNYQEKVLGEKPDLVVSEFVNDAYMSPEQVEQSYSKFLADFKAIGAEWIILTPHYVRPDWMGLTSQRDIDADPRPYVAGLRQFAARHHVALADASLRWGRLWRQGIPYNTLHMNAINHPNPQGMKMFADSLMGLFP